MPKHPDISEFYDEARAQAEQVQWLLSGPYRRYLAFVLPRIERESIRSVIEYGCGSGLVAAGLPEVHYVGIDKNPHFLDMAWKRCGNSAPLMRRFVCFDARNHATEPADLAMAWSFLKHFSLDEWDRMVRLVLQ